MDSSSPAVVPLLANLRVLSFGTFVAGNVCPLLLAELGADVVKVESKVRPEALRAYDGPEQTQVFEPSGMRTTALFAGLTRGMRSACIDMKTAAGRETLRSLVGRADVVIENLGPGTMESWGCAYEELKRHNPKLVMVSISGYGRSGPMAKFRAYASSINSYVGLTTAWAPDGTHFDFVAGIHGASAVIAGLAQVDRGSPGVFVDLAQSETGAAVMAPLYLDYLANGADRRPAPNEVPGAWFSGVVRCAGTDAWVAVELEDRHDWERMCQYLQRPDLRFEDDERTPERTAMLRQALEHRAAELSPLQVAIGLQRLGVAAGPVQNNEDLWRDVQHRTRRAFVEVPHPDLGVIEYPNCPDRLSTTPGRVRAGGPRLGANTNAVLEEWLGLGGSDVEKLAATGAIWQADEGATRRGRVAGMR
jgi:benzylsuccinate CoA-transferase BbsF subunit